MSEKDKVLVVGGADAARGDITEVLKNAGVNVMSFTDHARAARARMAQHWSDREKTCKRCGATHYHHNDYCSAECCLRSQSGKKARRKLQRLLKRKERGDA